MKNHDLLVQVLGEIRMLQSKVDLIESILASSYASKNIQDTTTPSFESTESAVRISGILNMLWAANKAPVIPGTLAIDFQQVDDLPSTFNLTNDPENAFRYLWSAAWRFGRNRVIDDFPGFARGAAMLTFNATDRGNGLMYEIALTRPDVIFGISDDPVHYWQDPSQAFSRVAGRLPTFTGPQIGQHTFWTPLPVFTNPQNPSDRSKEHPPLSEIGWGTYTPDDYPACFRAVNEYARRIGYGYGWPTYKFTDGKMWLGLLPREWVQITEVHFGTLAVLGSSFPIGQVESAVPWGATSVPYPIVSPTVGQIDIVVPSSDSGDAIGGGNPQTTGFIIPVGR
jgi:hypothetical protein